MDLGGLGFKELIPLFVLADTVVINEKVYKNRFGNVEELDEKGLMGRKEYLEEVVEVDKGRVNVYSSNSLKRMIKEELGTSESRIKQMYEKGNLKLVSER